MARQMNLVGFYKVPVAHYSSMWKHPLTDPGLIGPALPASVARTLEQGLFDMVFIPDGMVTFATGGGIGDSFQHGAAGSLEFDPTVVLAGMAAATSRIGLGCTMSTTFTPPFNIARQLGTLDVMSGGRVAWNIVTSHSSSQAQAFGQETIAPTPVRYEMADEVVEAVSALWNSWKPGALKMDRDSGVFVDPEKVERISYVGKHVSVTAPLPFPPSAQGRPLFMQAGASARGMEFAARWGEVVFAMQHTADDLRAFRSELRERAVAAGRNPDHLKVIASIVPIIGETEEIAQARRQYAFENVSLEASTAILSGHSGLNLAAYEMSTTLESIIADIGGAQSRGTAAQLQQAASAGMTTLEDAIRYFGVNGLTPELVGTGRQVAEQMRELFESGAADGFMIAPTDMPGSFEQFVRAVVPELQKMGIFRTSYEGETLRDIVGLPALTQEESA